MRKTIDLRSKSEDDLKSELTNARDELFRLKFQHATGQLENHQKMKQVKHDIARIMTVIKEREINNGIEK